MWQTLQVHSDLLPIVFVSFFATGTTVSPSVCVEVRILFVIQMSFTTLVFDLIVMPATSNRVLTVFFLSACL